MNGSTNPKAPSYGTPSEIEACLTRLLVGNPDFEELESHFDAFCPFEAVGMITQEIRHASFLRYLLDPQRPHGFGAECLKALMTSAAAAQEEEWQLTPLEVHLMNLEGARVHSEWQRVDLLIELRAEKVIVAIELKIDAREGGNQLHRYKQLVRDNYPSDEWRHLFVYLTKRGDSPSISHGDGWFALPLEMLATELTHVLRRKGGSDDARRMLSAYLNMLRRHHLPNDNLDELAEKLWEQHREALTFLMQRQPNAPGAFFRELFNRRAELAPLLSEAAGFRVVEDHSNRGYLRFAIEPWDQLPEFRSASNWTLSNRLLLVEVERSGDAIKVKFCLGQGSPDPRERIHNALIEGGALTNPKEQKLSKTWKSLASKTLYRVSEETKSDPDKAWNAVTKGLTEWARNVIPTFDAALRKELRAG